MVKIFSFLVFCAIIAHKPSFAQNKLLEDYIQEAFLNNEGIKRKHFELEQSLHALKEAKSYFLPHMSLNASYTRAKGGRTIDLPVGDMLNPVYATLNQLTMSNRFPQIQNESILLNPDNFYDVKLHTTLSLINMEIWYNKQIKQKIISHQEAELKVYQRELVKDIKVAYHKYCQSIQVIKVYKNSLGIAEEHIRINESLFKNGQINATVLLRANTEKEKLVATISKAENNCNNAKAYFNFLLNRSLDQPIETDSSFNLDNIDVLDKSTIRNREELEQLKIWNNISEFTYKMNKASIVPRLNTFLDLGSQSFIHDISDKSLYYFWGIGLQWDLFSGWKNSNLIKQSKYNLKITASKYEEAFSLFQLQAEQSLNNLKTAITTYNSVLAQEKLARKYYNDLQKVYKEGKLLFIELIEAQNQWTDAQINLYLAQAEINIAKAELERVRAEYSL